MEIKSGGVGTEGGNPFQGNQTFRILIVVLGGLVLIGALCLGLVILGIVPVNRQVSVRATATLVSIATATPGAGVTRPAPAQPTPAPAQPTAIAAAATAVPPGSAPATIPPTSTLVVVTSATETPQPTAGIPTITPGSPQGAAARATSRPAGSGGAGSGAGPLNGVFITGLAYEPAYPQKNSPVSFYATLINRTGKDQNYPLCAEIFHPDGKKAFGTTNCDVVTIPPGTNRVFIGNWIASGIKQCIPIRARAVYREQGGELRLPLTQPNGGELWTDLGVCP